MVISHVFCWSRRRTTWTDLLAGLLSFSFSLTFLLFSYATLSCCGINGKCKCFVAPLPSVELHAFAQGKCLSSIALRSLCLLRSAQSGLVYILWFVHLYNCFLLLTFLWAWASLVSKIQGLQRQMNKCCLSLSFAEELLHCWSWKNHTLRNEKALIVWP